MREIGSNINPKTLDERSMSRLPSAVALGERVRDDKDGVRMDKCRQTNLEKG